MSLITDLLSKVKQHDSKRDVPPILKDAVVQSTAERRTRKKLTLAFVIALVVVAVGFGTVTLIDYLKEPSLVTSMPLTTAPAVQPSPQITAQPPQPQSEVRTFAATSVDQKVTETAVTPERKKDFLTHSRGKKIITKKYAQRINPKTAGKLREMKQHKATSGMDSQEHGDGVEKVSGQDKDFYLYGARTYEMQGKYRQALSYYKKVLTVEPNNYVVMNNISGMLIYLSSYEEAIRYAQKALNIKKDYVSPLINMGISYGHLGKYSESESYFRRALTVESSNSLALLNLGLLYEKQNAFDKANQYYMKLTDAGDAQGYLGLARIAEKQKKVTDAIYFYRMVMSTDTVDPQIVNTANERLLQLTK